MSSVVLQDRRRCRSELSAGDFMLNLAMEADWKDSHASALPPSLPLLPLLFAAERCVVSSWLKELRTPLLHHCS